MVPDPIFRMALFFSISWWNHISDYHTVLNSYHWTCWQFTPLNYADVLSWMVIFHLVHSQWKWFFGTIRTPHIVKISLLWRHNDHDSVSNHQPRGCLLSRLFRRRSKKTSKLRVTGLCVGNSPGPVNSPHTGPVTRKMFPFDDVIMLMMLYSVRHYIDTIKSHYQKLEQVIVMITWSWNGDTGGKTISGLNHIMWHQLQIMVPIRLFLIYACCMICRHVTHKHIWKKRYGSFLDKKF